MNVNTLNTLRSLSRSPTTRFSHQVHNLFWKSFHPFTASCPRSRSCWQHEVQRLRIFTGYFLPSYSIQWDWGYCPQPTTLGRKEEALEGPSGRFHKAGLTPCSVHSHLCSADPSSWVTSSAFLGYCGWSPYSIFLYCVSLHVILLPLSLAFLWLTAQPGNPCHIF
jgi:hypothetical protein